MNGAARAAAVCTVPETTEEPLDLNTLLGGLLALRQEVNLQTRAVRAQQELNTETLRQLNEALQALNQVQTETEEEPPSPGPEEILRPVLKTLLDVHDALSLASREAQRARQPILETFQNPPRLDNQQVALRPGGMAAWLGWGARDRGENHVQDYQRVVQQSWNQTAQRAGQLVDALLTGYTMSLRRVERALAQFHLEPIPAVGQPFDPELMEVVETVSDSGKPAGEVTEELRRGYLWNGRVFRYAQVRVAKP